AGCSRWPVTPACSAPTRLPAGVRAPSTHRRRISMGLSKSELALVSRLHGKGKPTAAELEVLVRALKGLAPGVLWKLALSQGRFDMPTAQHNTVVEALKRLDTTLDHNRATGIVHLLGGILAGQKPRVNWTTVRQELAELGRKLQREPNPHPDAVAAFERGHDALDRVVRAHFVSDSDRERRLHTALLEQIEEAMRKGPLPSAPTATAAGPEHDMLLDALDKLTLERIMGHPDAKHYSAVTQFRG